jgi:8-oxo-dGTP diphosphatase
MKKPISQKIVLGAIVFNQNNEVLILQRHNNERILPGLWELPSGRREPLETSQETLLREVKEESGLQVKILLPSSVFEYQIEKSDEVRDTTQINFIVKTQSNKVKLSSEHQDFAWVSSKKLKNYQVSNKTREAIKKAFKIKKLLA